MRYEYATPPLEKDNQFANFDPATGTMVFAKDGSVFERALIHPDRNNVAPRIGFAYAPWKRMVVRGGYGIFYTHTVRQGREGLLGFNPPYLIDNLLQTSVSGAAAVASAAPFRLVNGYPSGLLDPGAIAQTVGRRAQDANQRTPYIQQFNIGAQYELRPDLVLDVAFVGNKGTKLNGFRNLNQRAVITNPDGSQSAGARPYPNFGDIQWMENRVSSTYKSLQTRLEKRFSNGLSGLVSYTWGEALTGAPDHISTSGGGPGFDTGVFREPQDGNNLRAEYGPVGVRHHPPSRRQLCVGAALRQRPAFRERLDGPDGVSPRRLAAHRHPRGAERSRADGDARRVDGAQHRWRAAGPAEPRRRSGAAGIRTDAVALFQHRRVRRLQPGNAGVWQRRHRHHARPGVRELRFHAGEELPGRATAGRSSSARSCSTRSTTRISARRTFSGNRAASARS